jgi:hypothetical protein
MPVTLYQFGGGSVVKAVYAGRQVILDRTEAPEALTDQVRNHLNLPEHAIPEVVDAIVRMPEQKFSIRV